MPKMRAAKLYDIGKLKVETVEIPEIGPSEVLIKTRVCGVCGTDVSMFRGRYLPVKPIIPGHEFSGEVVEIGEGVKNVKAGDRVTADENVSCGVCYYCKRQQKLMCTSLYQIGIHSDGGFAEYFKAPEGNVIRIPDELSYEGAAFTEPLACAIRAVDRAQIVPGDFVVVIGDGPIGLSVAQVARLSGASQVVVCGHHEYRMSKALEIGADGVIDSRKKDPVSAVFELTERRGADVVLEAVGKVSTYSQALEIVRRGGHVAVMGVPSAKESIDLKLFDQIFNKEMTLHASFAGTYDTWIRAVSLISSGKFKVDPLITHRAGLEELPRAIELMEKRAENVIKIMTSPEYQGITELR